MKKLEVGPMHIHTGSSMGFPRSIPSTPDFMIEFGEKGEDYGGCVVYYLGGCNRGHTRGFPDTEQTYDPKNLASLIAKAPKVLQANAMLRDELKKLNKKYQELIDLYCKELK